MAPSDTLESLAGEIVEKATDPNTFDLKAYVKAGAITLPHDSVDVLTDVEAGYEIAYTIRPEMDLIAKESEGTVAGEPDDEDPRVVALRAREKELQARIQATRITFNLRGVAPRLRKVIERDAIRRAKKDEWDEEELGEWQNTELLRASIVSVVFHKDGRTVTDAWDHDDLYDLWSNLLVDQQNKLFEKLIALTYGVVLAPSVVDAGFPGGTADEAGELRDPAAGSDGNPESAASV